MELCLQPTSKGVYLNYDVLIVLLTHLDKIQDLLSLMSTCRILRSAGMPYALGFRLEICSDQRLASLCRFLLSEGPRRLTFLRQLAVLTYPDSSATVDLYLQVLRSAQVLEDIEVWCGLPSIDSRIHSAVSSLTSVRTLAVRNLLSREASLLRRMQSPVEKVDISFQYYDQPVDPVWLLSRFAPTLEVLRVVLGYQQRDSPRVSYPRLHTLVAESCIFDKIGPLIDAFPNLRDLTIFSYRDEESVDEVIVDRQANLNAQKDRSWGTMERVSGDVLMLYRLGLRCKVSRLEIPWLESTAADSWTPSFKEMFAAVLSNTQPSTLTLIVRPAVFDMSHFPDFMRSMPECVQKFILTVYITGSTDAAKVIDDIFAALYPLNITHFVLRVKWYDTRRGSAARDPHPTEQYLKHASSTKLAKDLIQASSSIGYFFVELAGQKMSFWKIENTSGDKVPRVLSTQMAAVATAGDRF